MATIALDSFEEKPAGKPPISVHPAFPAIVALWFSALLGLGSLVLPAALLDRVVEATGLAALIPAAAPPLGFTARAAIALAGALLGALLGVAVARRVAQAHASEPETRAAKLAAGLRRPISVHEELGGEAVINGHGLPINRRRALAISEDDRPSDFLYYAPLPGEDPEATGRGFAPPAAEEPLELCDAIDDHEPQAAASEDGAVSAMPEFEPAAPLQSLEEPEAAEADEREARNNRAGARGLEPLPFSPPSLARRAFEPVFEPEPEPEPEPQPELEQEQPVTFNSVPEVAAEPEAVEPRADWATAPLEGLGLVQLVQRLGSTIERRRDMIAQQAMAVPAPVCVVAADLEAAPAEEAAEAMAAYFGTAPRTPAPAEFDPPVFSAPAEFPADQDEEAAPELARPSVLRPFGATDEDDGEEAMPDFSLPLRRPIAADTDFDPAEGIDEPEELDETDAAGGYSSLLGMSNPFAAPKAEFVRIEEPEAEPEMPPPAVVFPGQASLRAADPAPAGGQRLFDPPGKSPAPGFTAQQAPSVDTDAALRSVLATLQRMSGAA